METNEKEEITEVLKPKKAPRFHIRNMQKWDVSEVLEIWKEIGLYEGTRTIESFLEVDPDGFYVAVKDDDGMLLGCCAGVFVDPSVAFIGLYAVRRRYQNLGIGIQIWNKMMEHIADGNAGLYAVPEQFSTYKDRAGFTKEDETRVVVYDSNSVTSDGLTNSIENVVTVAIDDEILEHVVNYDSEVIGCRRHKLLSLTFREEGSLSLAALDEDLHKVVGYGCFRTNNGNKAMAGPIYADSQAIAELITARLIDAFPLAREAGLYYMTPDTNEGGVSLAAKLGLEKHEELPRLFTKQVPKADIKRIYCIHSPNFSPF